jgi:hypothetical protein
VIPDEKKPAITRALFETFGVKVYEDIRPTSGEQSSVMVFQMIVREKPYLLKIMCKEVISDPLNVFTCMKTAADAGITSQVRNANAEDRALITDFAAAKPSPDNLVALIAPVLRKLHSLPDF